MSSSEIPNEDQHVKSKSLLDEVPQQSVRSIIIKQLNYEVGAEEEEDLCDSAHLLIKNTESFKCLAQVILSNSSLLRHPLYYFPPLVDPGIDDAFNYVDPEPVYDDIGVEKYLDMCKELEIVPISRIMASLEEDTLNLKYYGLTDKQMKALTETLIENSHVENLILEDNFFNPDVAEMLSTVIQKNHTITVLNLKECRLGELGAEKLSDALASTQHLLELDLSFNELGDKGLYILQDGLADTLSLKKLNLSHNHLTEESAAVLQQILRDNITIEDLDLSWNQFCTGPGNKKICIAISRNDRIKALNLAWNGISVRPAVVPLMRYLRKSEKIEYLDLSNNRLAAGSLKAARTGILKNHSLKMVKIGNNIYSPEEAYSLASIMTTKQTDPLSVLDMENMYFKKDILPVLSRVKQMGKTLKIGGILSNYIIKDPDINKVLFERCRYILQKPKKKKAKKDFGHFILSLPTNSISREEFDDLLKKKKMKKLDKDLIDGIVERFPAKKQKIDVVGLTKIYMDMYPDTQLPPPKPKKKKGKKGKKEAKLQTEVVAQQPLPPVTEEQAVASETATGEQEVIVVKNENELMGDLENTPVLIKEDEVVESLQNEPTPTNEETLLEGQDSVVTVGESMGTIQLEQLSVQPERSEEYEQQTID